MDKDGGENKDEEIINVKNIVYYGKRRNFVKSFRES